MLYVLISIFPYGSSEVAVLPLAGIEIGLYIYLHSIRCVYSWNNTDPSINYSNAIVYPLFFRVQRFVFPAFV
jgi:hypothetical protein